MKLLLPNIKKVEEKTSNNKIWNYNILFKKNKKRIKNKKYY